MNKRPLLVLCCALLLAGLAFGVAAQEDDQPSLCTDGTWFCPDPDNPAREEWNWSAGWYLGMYFAGRIGVDDIPEWVGLVFDSDGDGVEDKLDACPFNPSKWVDAGVCGRGKPDGPDDVDNDGIPDNCDGSIDSDGDGVPNDTDVCPFDPNKSVDAGQCGCGVADIDADGDGIADCNDFCPNIADGGNGEVGCPLPAVGCISGGGGGSYYYSGGRGTTPPGSGVIGPFGAYTNPTCAGTPTWWEYMSFNESAASQSAQCFAIGLGAWNTGSYYGFPAYFGACW